VLCYFAILIHDPVPVDSNECILSLTDVTVTTETPVASFEGFHQTKIHLEGENYYADKLLFLKYLQ